MVLIILNIKRTPEIMEKLPLAYFNAQYIIKIVGRANFIYEGIYVILVSPDAYFTHYITFENL